MDYLYSRGLHSICSTDVSGDNDNTTCGKLSKQRLVLDARCSLRTIRAEHIQGPAVVTIKVPREVSTEVTPFRNQMP